MLFLCTFVHRGKEKQMEKIDELLIRIGIYPDKKGFHYIKKAVDIINDNRRKMVSTMDLYTEIADCFETSKERVERAIRYCIKRADLSEMFIKDEHVTNSKFLCVIALMAIEKEDNKDE